MNEVEIQDIDNRINLLSSEIINHSTNDRPLSAYNLQKSVNSLTQKKTELIEDSKSSKSIIGKSTCKKQKTSSTKRSKYTYPEGMVDSKEKQKFRAQARIEAKNMKGG